jgi:glycosyltransferase involved in cell wall biosynthesis
MLREIARHLGAEGHSVEIYCTQRPDNRTEFPLAPGVKVFPTLRFKHCYPEPYYTAPYNLSAVICDLLEAAAHADVFYVHDGELAYPFIYDQLPTVISFRDLVYPDTLACGLGFRGDTLIVASEYMRNSVIDVLARFRSGIAERVVAIANGVDLERFRPDTGSDYPVQVPDNALLLLCPHRPDKRKGFSLALQLLSKIKSSPVARGRMPLLLIPKWVDSNIEENGTHEYQSLYGSLIDEARDLGVHGDILIHPWMRDEQIPSYYSRASVVLCAGTFIEAFGNVPLECAACGVPSIVSSVGGHVGKLPIPLSYEVPPDDVDAAFDATCRALKTIFPVDKAREFLRKNYSLKTMVKAYSAQITSQRRLPPLPVKQIDPFGDGAALRQPAWCRFIGRGVYNDYAYATCEQHDLLRLYQPGVLPASSSALIRLGYSREVLRDFIQRGYLTYS